MQKKLHIKKGDNVVVIAGDSKGKTGRVLEVIVEKERAIVENINMVSKHTKPNAKTPKGGIVKKESSVHVSNLMKAENAKVAKTAVEKKTKKSETK
jgi:large subunit ribosomal protein L24